MSSNREVGLPESASDSLEEELSPEVVQKKSDREKEPLLERESF